MRGSDGRMARELISASIVRIATSYSGLVAIVFVSEPSEYFALALALTLEAEEGTKVVSE